MLEAVANLRALLPKGRVESLGEYENRLVLYLLVLVDANHVRRPRFLEDLGREFRVAGRHEHKIKFYARTLNNLPEVVLVQILAQAPAVLDQDCVAFAVDSFDLRVDHGAERAQADVFGPDLARCHAVPREVDCPGLVVEQGPPKVVFGAVHLGKRYLYI